MNDVRRSLFLSEALLPKLPATRKPAPPPNVLRDQAPNMLHEGEHKNWARNCWPPGEKPRSARPPHDAEETSRRPSSSSSSSSNDSKQRKKRPSRRVVVAYNGSSPARGSVDALEASPSKRQGKGRRIVQMKSSRKKKKSTPERHRSPPSKQRGAAWHSADKKQLTPCLLFEGSIVTPSPEAATTPTTSLATPSSADRQSSIMDEELDGQRDAFCSPTRFFDAGDGLHESPFDSDFDGDEDMCRCVSRTKLLAYLDEDADLQVSLGSSRNEPVDSHAHAVEDHDTVPIEDNDEKAINRDLRMSSIVLNLERAALVDDDYAIEEEDTQMRGAQCDDDNDDWSWRDEFTMVVDDDDAPDDDEAPALPPLFALSDSPSEDEPAILQCRGVPAAFAASSLPLAPLPEDRPIHIDARGVPLLDSSAVDKCTAKLRGADAPAARSRHQWPNNFRRNSRSLRSRF